MKLFTVPRDIHDQVKDLYGIPNISFPSLTRPAAKLTAVVVLPTPPF
jgi:hypothetical protein